MTGDHDYDPSWDYDIDKRPPKAMAAEAWEVYESPIHKEARSELGLRGGSIHFVRDLGEEAHLGRYINGTYSDPVFVLDLRHIRKVAKRVGLDTWTALSTTLLHEYGHAYADSIGVEPEDEEEAVEAYARSVWHGEVYPGEHRSTLDALLSSRP